MTEEKKDKTDNQGQEAQPPVEEKKPVKNVPKQSWGMAFNEQEQFNSLRYLVETGQDPRDLLMRSLIPSKRTDAYRLMIALETVLKKCIKFGDKEGEKEIRDILALLPSCDGKGRDQLVAAMIGGYFGDRDGGENGEGLTARLKRVAFGGR